MRPLMETNLLMERHSMKWPWLRHCIISKSRSWNISSATYCQSPDKSDEMVAENPRMRPRLWLNLAHRGKRPAPMR